MPADVLPKTIAIIGGGPAGLMAAEGAVRDSRETRWGILVRICS